MAELTEEILHANMVHKTDIKLANYLPGTQSS